VNPFYLEHVPFERTERAIRISQDVFGANVMVYQLEYYRRFKAMGIKARVRFEDYLKLEKGEDFARNVEFFMMGRAPYRLGRKFGALFPKYPADRLFTDPCRPPFLRDWHNHFDNYGNYIPGYCGGISLGDCRRLEELMQTGVQIEEYPVLGFLLNGDMQGLWRFGKEFGYTESPEGYFSKCHLCVDIRKHLVTKHPFRELRPQAFYLHLEGQGGAKT
jgi:hypothetical protein